MARRKKAKRRRRPETAPALTDPLTIRAAGVLAADVPGSFRISGASADFQILAEDGGGDVDAAGKPVLKKFAMTAYTGVPMRLAGFQWPVIVDLAGLSPPRDSGPILKGHDPESIVGHWTKAEASSQRIKLAGVMSGVGDAAKEVMQTAANGFPWQASIGASSNRMEFVDRGEEVNVNGRNWQGPLYVSRQTVLGEVSFVPIGADNATSALVAARPTSGDGSVNFETWLKAAGFDPATLPDNQKKLLKAAYDAEMRAAGTPVVTPPAAPVNAAGAAGAVVPPVDIAAEFAQQLAAGRKLIADESKRVGAIDLLCSRYGVSEVEIDGADGKKVKVNIKAHAVEAGWAPNEVELHLLRAARPTVPGGLVFSNSTPEVNEVVLEAAVLQAARHQFHLEDDDFYFSTMEGQKVRRVPEKVQRETQRDLKARYTDQAMQAAHTMFKGRIAPKQLMQVYFRANRHTQELDLSGEVGVKNAMMAWDHFERERTIRGEGSSTMSLSNVLANVLNKFALQGYLFVEQAWRDICGVRPVNDFKPTKSINLLGDVMYKQLGPSGEIANASLGDQAFANQATPYGRILTIPWTHQVNDDLGILTGVPVKIGQGAGLSLNDVLWALVAKMAAGTVNGDDGNAFFRTGSSSTPGSAYKANKMSGGTSALSSAALTTAKALFDNQVDPNGNPLGFDGLTPILLHPPTLWRVATELTKYAQLVYGGGAAALQPQGNVWAGMLKPVMSRYLESANYGNSATGWYVLFNPMALAAIEICFLNGVDSPAVLQAGPDYQFDKLGISIRGTMPFGITQQNFRAAVYSVGA
jgi:hypothetical protein